MSDAAPLDDETFKAELVLLIRHLRAFAYSIVRGPGADDLAQEAMLRAWKSRASYKPDTNMKAWVFTILRNLHFSENRRSWRSQPLDPEVAENTLVANDDPSASEELLDVRNAMLLLPEDQREALALVGAAGLSYEETANICGCAIGTVKSRVSRARVALTAILETRKSGSRMKTDVSSTGVFEDIMQHADRVRRRLEPAA